MDGLQSAIAPVAAEVRTGRASQWASNIGDFWVRHEKVLTVLILFAGTVALAFLFKPFKQAEQGDPSVYDYIAQSILRGGLPYRDAIDPKAPGSMYLSAFALVLGRLFHIPDIFAIRLFHILLYGLLSVATYLVASAFLNDRWAAVLAVLLPLLPGRFTVMMIIGTQPKLPMILFGMLALAAMYRDKPLLAGIMSMLSCLCWQPGLMFTGVAVLYFSRYLTHWKDRRAAKVILGAAIPLLITIFYFWLRGGLSKFVGWTFTYDYSVYMPTDEKPFRLALFHFMKVINKTFRKELLVFCLAAGGVCWYLIHRVVEMIRSRTLLSLPEPRALFRDAAAMPVIVYFAFCMINMQSGPDLIPFLPFFGIFGAFAVLELSRGLDWLLRSSEPKTRQRLSKGFVVLVTFVALFYVVKLGRKYRLEWPTLAQQYRDLEAVKVYLRPGDKIYAHGSTEVLVFLNIDNASPYTSFDTRADDYIAASTPGGFPAVIAGIDAQAPKIVVMTRLIRVKHRKEIEDWISRNYTLIHVPSLMAIYVRNSFLEQSALDP